MASPADRSTSELQPANTVPARYLRYFHHADDHVAVLAIPRKGGTLYQRFPTAEAACSTKYQAWLRHLNADGYDIYVSSNPIRPDRGLREKRDVAYIRRLQLDLDEAGTVNLNHLLDDVSAARLPKPAHTLRSSNDHYQVFWNCASAHWDASKAEVVMKGLAQRYGGDPNVAEVARVMRWPGFRNKKPGRSNAMVSWRPYKGSPVLLADFRNMLRDVPPAPSTPAPGALRQPGFGNSQSERDWAWARSELRRGADPDTLISTLEARRQDKPKPAYYARRTVTRAHESLRTQSLGISR